ncbi:MAG: outer membrane beta-barrel protein [Bryobacteraceae bacterium]
MRSFPVVLVLLAAVPAGAQQFWFGVKGGVPVTPILTAGIGDPFNAYTVYTNPYIVGATAEIRLTRGLSIGVDALMRHWSYLDRGKYQPGFSVFSSRTTANDWEFPLFARYRLRRGKAIDPFVNAGAAVDWLQGLRQSTTVTYFIGGSTPTTFSTYPPQELQRRTTAGVVGGGGVDLKCGRVHVEPEVRYTYWTGRHFGNPSPVLPALGYVPSLDSARDQVEVLLGITF